MNNDQQSLTHYQARDNKKTIDRLARIAGDVEPYADPNDCLKTLRRRLKYLDERILSHDESDEGLTYDRAERRALRWALEKLEAWYATEKAAKQARKDAQND